MSDHVRHMGFELELAATKIYYVLIHLRSEDRKVVLDHLAPVRLRRAVEDMLTRRHDV